MILKHTVKSDGSCTLSRETSPKGFWGKQSVQGVEDFCNKTDFSLEIISATQFKLVKE
jgi:hypothetical protein